MPTTSISRCGGVVGSGFVAALEATNPNALWPLTETSGTIAYDALSGHHDAAAIGSPATWAAYTNRIGTPSPHFGVQQGYRTDSLNYAPNLAGDFTAAIWVFRPSSQFDECIGQDVVEVNRRGWMISLMGGANVNPDHVSLEVGGGGIVTYIPADAAMSLNTWYWVCITHTGALWNIYVNAVLQSASYSGTYTVAADQRIWMGYSGTTYGLVPDEGLGYGALWATRALSASEIAGIYAAAPP